MALPNRINFRKNSKQPSTPPHFRKITLQIFSENVRKKLYNWSKICNIIFWIENDPSPLWNFSKYSFDLVQPTVPQHHFHFIIFFGTLYLTNAPTPTKSQNRIMLKKSFFWWYDVVRHVSIPISHGHTSAHSFVHYHHFLEFFLQNLNILKQFICL